MNFLSLRGELQNWTLSSDDKLYKAIKQLSDTVLQAQKLIINNIQTTRYEAIKSHVESGCSYNQYLRISETKFTENKIGEKSVMEKKEDQAIKGEGKNKMDLFKEAIEIGTRNLDITEEKGGDNDLVSVSDTALSQSIYRDCRVPAFYGTKEFAMNSFLNLFTNNELNAQVPTQKFETNELVMNNQMVESEVLPPPPSLNTIVNQDYSNLPPPPSLETVLNSNRLPPPPSLANLPPPPPIGSLPVPPPLLNLPPPTIGPAINLPPPSPLNVQKVEKNDQEEIQRREERVEVSIAPPSQPRQLSVQEELALRLKHGKNYKKEIEINIEEPKPKEASKVQVSVSVPAPNENKLPMISEQRESADQNPRSSYRNSYGINLNPLLNPNLIKPPAQEEHEQEEVDSFFGPSKNKNKESKKPITIQNDIMKRETFNEDILFKKKPLPEKKEITKPKNTLFGEDEEEQTDFTFKKKEKKEDPKPKANPFAKDTKKKNILDSESDQDTSGLFKKKTEPKAVPAKVEPPPSPQKKPLNPLFKPSEPPKEVTIKVTEVKKENKEEITVKVSETTNKEAQGVKNKQSLTVQPQQQSVKIGRTSSTLSNQSHASNYAMRVAAAGSQVMGMGMGMPMMPKGMVFTKPSQTKRNEEEALKRLKVQEEEEKLARLEQEKRLQKERQQDLERQVELQKKREEEERLRKELIKKQEEETLKFQPKKQVQVRVQVTQKPVPSPTKVAPKKNNALFDDEDDNEDIFKPKAKKLTQNSEFTPASKEQPKIEEQTLTVSQKMPPAEEKIVIETKPSVQSQSQQSNTKGELAVRRKKAKPTFKSQALFGQDEPQIIEKIPVSSLKEAPKKVEVVQEKSQGLSYAQKMSSSSQMGPLPMIPKGMVLTKPSEVKSEENIAIQNMKKEKEQLEIKKRLEEEAEQKRKLEEAERMKKESQERKEKQRQLAEQKRLQQAELLRIEKEKQLEQQGRLDQQKRIEQQRRFEQKKKLEQQRRVEEQRRLEQVERKRAEQEERAQKEQMRLEELRRQEQLRRIEEARREEQRRQQEARIQQEKRRREQLQRQEEMRRQRQAEELRIQKERQAEEQRRKAEQAKKAVPFLPKIPTRSNQPLGGPLIPSLPKAATKQPLQTGIQSKKGSLFNDEDEGELTFNKAPKPVASKPSNTISQKRGLFDDDDDLDNSNFLSSKKPTQPQPKPEDNKGSKMFNEEEEEIVVSKAKIMPTEPARQPMVSKEAPKKKSLFDDDDDLESNTFLKRPAAKNESVSPQIPHPSPQKMPISHSQPPQMVQKQPLAQKKGLFDEEETDQIVVVKKPLPQKAPAPVSITQKKGLFDDNDDDDGFLSKKPQKSPAPIAATQKKETLPIAKPKKKNLFDDSGSDDDFTLKKKKG